MICNDRPEVALNENDCDQEFLQFRQITRFQELNPQLALVKAKLLFQGLGVVLDKKWAVDASTFLRIWTVFLNFHRSSNTEIVAQEKLR